MKGFPWRVSISILPDETGRSPKVGVDPFERLTFGLIYGGLGLMFWMPFCHGAASALQEQAVWVVLAG
jgi:hypothetical protein